MAKQVTRQYIFTEGQTRLMFIASSILMVATVVGFLILSSSRPQGSFTTNLDRSPYLNNLQGATESLEGYRENPDGTVSIPIERAMELVAERGVVNPFKAE
jgi:hypothetical protein